jgi:hypothetical protein
MSDYGLLGDASDELPDMHMPDDAFDDELEVEDSAGDIRFANQTDSASEFPEDAETLDDIITWLRSLGTFQRTAESVAIALGYATSMSEFVATLEVLDIVCHEVRHGERLGMTFAIRDNQRTWIGGSKFGWPHARIVAQLAANANDDELKGNVA